MRLTFPLCIGLAIGALPAVAQTPAPDIYALVGIRVEVGDGRVIEKTTVLLRHGIIEAIGPDMKIPAEAEVIKGEGLTVYPGFMDAQMSAGVTPPAAQPDQDTAPDTASYAPASMRLANRKGIRPELRAADYLTLTEASLTPLRQAGFTSALIAPPGGGISGVSALVNLSGTPRRDSVVRPAVTMGFGFGGARTFNPNQDGQQRSSGTGYPGSLLGYIALLRQTLLDARYYKTVETAFAKGGSQRPPTDDSLMALQPVLSGEMPVVFDADSENQIVRAMHIADEFGLKLVVNGGAEAWKLAPTLAKKQIPVLVSLNFGDEPGVARAAGGPGSAPGGGLRLGGGGGRPGGRRNGTPGGAVPGAPPADPNAPVTTPTGVPGAAPSGRQTPAPGAAAAAPEDEDDTPKAVIAEQHRKWEEKIANVSKLQTAGVPFAFTMKGSRNPTDFMDSLRKAIKAGLSRENALKALTVNAAKFCNVDRQLGTVEKGKIADLVIMTGDFADAKTKVRYVFIDKSKFDLENDRPAARPAFPIPPPAEDDDQ